ncbi:MAG: hypothetical protein GY940_14245 [bacterium]|nr:hypothetical protein [bacterium]
MDKETLYNEVARHVSIDTLKEEFIDRCASLAYIELVYFENFRDIEGGFPFVLTAKKH